MKYKVGEAVLVDGRPLGMKNFKAVVTQYFPSLNVTVVLDEAGVRYAVQSIIGPYKEVMKPSNTQCCPSCGYSW